MHPGLTVGQLRRILLVADNDATIDEALAQLDDADRREAEDVAHSARLTAYNTYIKTHRERAHAAIQGAYDKAKQAAIADAGGAISRDRLHQTSASAADDERARFEAREPVLEFPDWVARGMPDVYTVRSPKFAGAKQ